MLVEDEECCCSVAMLRLSAKVSLERPCNKSPAEEEDEEDDEDELEDDEEADDDVDDLVGGEERSSVFVTPAVAVAATVVFVVGDVEEMEVAGPPPTAVSSVWVDLLTRDLRCRWDILRLLARVTSL